MDKKYTSIEQYFLDKMERLEQTNAELVNTNRTLLVEISKLEEKLKTNAKYLLFSYSNGGRATKQELFEIFF